MNDEEIQAKADELYEQLQKLGHFPLVVLTRNDLKEHLEWHEKSYSNQELDEVCYKVWLEWESGEEWLEALDQAANLITEKPEAA